MLKEEQIQEIVKYWLISSKDISLLYKKLCRYIKLKKEDFYKEYSLVVSEVKNKGILIE